MRNCDSNSCPRELSALRCHPVKVVDRLHPRKQILRIRNDHFTPLSVEIFTPEASAMLKRPDFQSHKARHEDALRFTEGIQTALYALYVLGCAHGECVVQREATGDYSVYSVQPVLESEKPEHRSDTGNLTFGADVECLLQRRKTGKWVAASSVIDLNGEIGYDDAISMKGKIVQHPIVELRPQPANSASLLHRNLLQLYERLEHFLQKNDLRAVVQGSDRYHVGGHLHVGNQQPTFRLVGVLDHFLAIPFALTASGDARKRRQRFGRLGSVRPNAFSGFEYRVLPSWHPLIPEMKPVLEWFCYMIRHPDYFPELDFDEGMLKGYYSHSVSNLSNRLDMVEGTCRVTLPNDHFSIFAEPFFNLVREKSGYPGPRTGKNLFDLKGTTSKSRVL